MRFINIPLILLGLVALGFFSMGFQLVVFLDNRLIRGIDGS